MKIARHLFIIISFIALAVIVALLVNINSFKIAGNKNSCSFANACKVLAYLTGYERDDERAASDYTYWFSDYYEYLCDIGMFKSEFDFSDNPNRVLLESDLAYIYEFLGIDVKSGLNNEKAVSVTSFAEIIKENKHKFNKGDKLSEMQLGIVATSGEAQSDSDVFDKPYTVSTNKGKYRYTGLSLTGYQDKTIDVLAMDDEILMLLSVAAESTTFKNVWINDFKDKILYVNMYGVNREFAIGGTTEDVSGMLADIILENGRIVGITIKKDITDTNVRILLYNSGTDSVKHDSVTITSDRTFYFKTSDTVWECSAGDSVIITAEYALHKDKDEKSIETKSRSGASDKITMTSSLGGQLTVLSLSKSQGSPAYEGDLNIYTDESGVVIVNEVAVESYLKRVVPSEMPVSFGTESLKVQAVCARSYAYAHIESYAYAEYEAHMDDTINFQVYNNTNEKQEANDAIAATAGKMMYYADTVVSAFYYSTSCGAGTDVSLWGSNTASYPYYTSRLISENTSDTDLSNESNFRKFISKSDEKDYDYGSTYYRWTIETSSDDISANLKKMGYSDIGSVTSVTVNKRVAGGAVNDVTICGTKADVRLESEGQIRKAFNLPSAFFVVDSNKSSKNASFTFTGGGYGHGIGMSQNAVKTMAARGMSYIEILQFFYSGVSVY